MHRLVGLGHHPGTQRQPLHDVLGAVKHLVQALQGRLQHQESVMAACLADMGLLWMQSFLKQIKTILNVATAQLLQQKALLQSVARFRSFQSGCLLVQNTYVSSCDMVHAGEG